MFPAIRMIRGHIIFNCEAMPCSLYSRYHLTCMMCDDDCVAVIDLINKRGPVIGMKILMDALEFFTEIDSILSDLITEAEDRYEYDI